MFMCGDREANTTTLILPLFGSSTDNEVRVARQEPFLSGNGQFLVFHSTRNFQSSEPELSQPKDDNNNGANDVFWYDTVTQPVPQVERLNRPDFTADQTCAGALRNYRRHRQPEAARAAS